jgi:hypothetical protein
MARITNDGISIMAWLKRITIFQLILNFINEAMLTVLPSAKIDKIKANYAVMQKQSQKALDALQGVTRLHAGETSTRLKRPKVPEIPKFDVHNKQGMQTFLNSMELLSHSYKFNDDKELAQFYLNTTSIKVTRSKKVTRALQEEASAKKNCRRPRTSKVRVLGRATQILVKTPCNCAFNPPKNGKFDRMHTE